MLPKIRAHPYGSVLTTFFFQLTRGHIHDIITTPGDVINPPSRPPVNSVNPPSLASYKSTSATPVDIISPSLHLYLLILCTHFLLWVMNLLCPTSADTINPAFCPPAADVLSPPFRPPVDFTNHFAW